MKEINYDQEIIIIQLLLLFRNYSIKAHVISLF